jgi:hypothetical protein
MRPVEFVADVAREAGLVDLFDVLELLRKQSKNLDEDQFDNLNEFEEDMIKYVQKYYSSRIKQNG